MRTYRVTHPSLKPRYYHIYPNMVILVKPEDGKYRHSIIGRDAAAWLLWTMRDVATVERI